MHHPARDQHRHTVSGGTLNANASHYHGGITDPQYGGYVDSSAGGVGAWFNRAAIGGGGTACWFTTYNNAAHTHTMSFTSGYDDDHSHTHSISNIAVSGTIGAGVGATSTSNLPQYFKVKFYIRIK